MFLINKTQQMCDKAVLENGETLVRVCYWLLQKSKCCHYRYRTQEICNKTVDDFLPALSLFLIGLLQEKWLKNFLLIYSQIIIYFNEDSGNAIFSCDEIDILRVDFSNINLDDTNYDEDDAEIIINNKLLAWHIEFEKRKTLKRRVKWRINAFSVAS